jgi:hypothetical protein
MARCKWAFVVGARARSCRAEFGRVRIKKTSDRRGRLLTPKRHRSFSDGSRVE